MSSKQLQTSPCPIFRGLQRVGDWWSMLIMRDALFYNLTRFDEFQKSLHISPNLLTTRLAALVEAGLLDKRKYSDKPARYEYVVTEMGRDFMPVLVSIMSWGNKHFAAEGLSVVLRDMQSGADVTPLLVDPATGAAISDQRHRYVAGPMASESLHERINAATERRRSAANE
jgi:DNA-binding HxlR family transcriptional regulator